MAELYKSITTLEQQHKRTQLMETYGELMQARRQLRDLLSKRHLRSLQQSKGFFYAHANKGGKYLARLLKGNAPRTQVRTLRLPSGASTAFPDQIAEEFRRYYQSLYNLQDRGRGEDGGADHSSTQEYLKETVTKTIHPDAAEELDAAITAEDI
ncbi:endonuclease reverse transcriptase [Pelobates cultripes]|uniref:Endonuclease reverse transcriptase n=1 Tax=Pelobates cultripes TaxID=61616 RepID=A0AAD1SL61_PELCU|nr:endonuclease reverse transcriptase [Pelobates cultripes]